MSFQKWMSSWSPVGAIGSMALFTTLAFLVACTDYVQQIADRDGEWNSSISSEMVKSSSSSVTPKSSDSETSVSTGTMTDSRDGQTYKTVTIGTQTWMAENLNYETPASHCYRDNASNCTKYGRLYTWAATMDSAGTWTANGKGCGDHKTCSPTYPVRGVCPEGWHLPDTTEWKTLVNAVGGDSTAGKVLMSTSGWNSSGNGMDSFGFSALPAGSWYSGGVSGDECYGDYCGEGYGAHFWSSTEGNSDSGRAYGMGLNYGNDNASLNSIDKSLGFSVRCLQDDASYKTVQSSSSEAAKSSSSVKLSSSSVTPKSSDSETSVSTGTMTDSRDAQTYKTVTIGTQTWMAENLNYKSSGYCYNNDVTNCTKYGRLYKWTTAVGKSESECGEGKTCSLPSGNIQGVCPSGWHLPSTAEWETLFNAVGGQSTAGSKLKSKTGFSALYAGYGSDHGYYYYDDEGNLLFDRYSYNGMGDGACFWSSTEYDINFAYYLDLRDEYGKANANLKYNPRNFMYSVRCLQD